MRGLIIRIIDRIDPRDMTDDHNDNDDLSEDEEVPGTLVERYVPPARATESEKGGGLMSDPEEEEEEADDVGGTQESIELLTPPMAGSVLGTAQKGADADRALLDVAPKELTYSVGKGKEVKTHGLQLFILRTTQLTLHLIPSRQRKGQRGITIKPTSYLSSPVLSCKSHKIPWLVRIRRATSFGIELRSSMTRI